jgi:hypothetical protein
VRIKEEAMPEWWLARQRELAEAREEAETAGGPPVLGSMTREEAEQALGGSLTRDEA